VSAQHLVREHLADARSSWAIGTFGAIAEFHRDEREAVELSADAALTARGGVRIHVSNGVRAFAWERPASGDAWTQGLALCLNHASAAMSGRTAVTELGPDSQALTPQGREEILFDLGIGAAHCDACVRTRDPELLLALRSASGQRLLDTPLFGELGAKSPTRVFLSRLGRIEVRTPIPVPQGRTPDGPHTHVLPGLLRLRRTHSATVPLPEGVFPCAEIYPESPVLDAHGARQRFERARYESFERLLTSYGDPACNAAKRETIRAVRAGKPPRDEPRYGRRERLARRVALRQLAQLDGPSPVLQAWQRAFDRAQATTACV